MKIPAYDIIVTVVFFTALLLLLSIFVITLLLLFQKRRQEYNREVIHLQYTYEQQLLQSRIEVQESTFSSLSKELHDNIGQLLSTSKMLLGIAQRELANPPDTLITAEATVGKAINELRSLSKSLSKEWLEQFNLLENLQGEVTRINSSNEIHIFLSSPQYISLETDKQIILFRITQEALQNAMKHGSPKNISVNITEDNTALIVQIKDDGAGFEAKENVTGIGIINMKHRAAILNGKIQWQTKVGEGTLVIIELPIKQSHD